VELFIDPKIKFPKLKVATKLARKIAGFRMLMDVIPVDASLVKGSHGRIPEDKLDWPVLIGDFQGFPNTGEIPAEDVCDFLFSHCCQGTGYSSPDLG
jgi:hypothetical protein